jgi:Flp pilus assembly protein TadD
MRYEILHLLGRAGEAWDFIQPMVESRKERLDVLGDVGVLLYTRGEITAARAVFEQLRAFAPDMARFACNLGFIEVGEGNLAAAKASFLQALDAPDSIEIQPPVLANLGHLYLIQGDYAQAETLLGQAVSQAGEQGAILRVAYWQEDRVVSEDATYRPRSLPIRMAANANRVTLALAQGQIKEAGDLAQQMAQEAPDAPWGFEMLGWVRRAEGKADEARRAWQSALRHATSPEEKEAIERWLETLPG